MEDYSYLRDKYRSMERSVLALILLPLPVFAFVYLNLTKPMRTIHVPELPAFLESFLLSLTLALLLFQHINFQRRIKPLQVEGADLDRKITGYLKASTVRYAILALVGLTAAAGLFFFANVGFTIAYAVVLVLVSVYKPSPIRMIRLLRLRGEEKEFVREINREYIEK
jgi:hypothetical protein